MYGLVHEAIAARAVKTPDAPALRSGRRWLSHGELHELVRCTQAALSTVLPTGGVPVVVITGRSEWAVVAMLGVWHAGCIYVPLEQSISEQRLQDVLRRIRPGAILTDSANSKRLRAGWTGCVVLEVERAAQARRPADRTVEPVRLRPDNLACIVHTSGSSGRSKGVMIEHSSLHNLVAEVASPYAPLPEHQALHFGALGWDSSIEEMILPLFRGTPLTMCTDEADFGVPHFLRQLAQQSISHLYLPTAYWREICRELRDGSERLPTSVQSVLIGGERASAEDLGVWRRSVAADVDLWNCYGLTETCVTSTIYRDDRDTPLGNFPSVPLGGPCPTVTTHVLDEQMGYVPAGSVGELYIGGPGVGRGYWDDPPGAASGFLPNPFGNGRLYRTGDLVMSDDEDRLHFVGRVDRQVKVNGFRVNPGEVEGVLTRHASVRLACVVSREQASGHLGLVAYLELVGPRADVGDVKAFLTERVPAFMLPASVVVLETMPLLPSGKVDVDALLRQGATTNPLASPTGTVDGGQAAGVLAIWCQALGIDTCGPDDEFFNLGGNSLSGMRIAARVNEQYGLAIRFREVLEHRTPAALAKHVEVLQAASWR